MKTEFKIDAKAIRDSLMRGGKYAFADIDYGKAHGSIGMYVLRERIYIHSDSPVHGEDVEFSNLHSAMKYYAHEKRRVLHAVKMWAEAHD